MSHRQRRPLRTLSMIALGLAGLTAPALAETRVAVVGDDPQTVKAVADALRSHKELSIVDIAAPPVVREASAKELAAAHSLNAVVAVRVTVDGATWTASVMAYEGDDAVVLASYEVKSGVAKLAAAAAAPAWKKLGKELQAAEAPSTTAVAPPDGGEGGGGAVAVTPPEPGTPPDPGAGTAVVTDPVTPPDTGAAVVAEPGPGPAGAGTGGAAAGAGAAGLVKPVLPSRPGRGAVRVGVAVEPFHRRLRYTDDIRNVTRAHDLTVPAVALSARIQPLAGQPLELTGAVQLSLGGSSTADDTAMDYDTRATEWSIGAGYGATVGPVDLMGRVGYGQQTFRIADDEQPGQEEIPDMDYRYVRIGAGATLAATSKLGLEAAFGYRYLLGAGDLDADPWFPRATGSGIDGDVGFRFALKPRLDLFAQFQVRHYFFSMNPEVGDPLIVGGAIDTYLGGSIGASLSAF